MATKKRRTVSVQAAREAVPGPIAGTRITDAYARMVARNAYFWAWPMINIYNKRLAFAQAPEPGLMGGILPVAPVNRVSMLTDYIERNASWRAPTRTSCTVAASSGSTPVRL